MAYRKPKHVANNKTDKNFDLVLCFLADVKLLDLQRSSAEGPCHLQKGCDRQQTDMVHL